MKFMPYSFWRRTRSGCRYHTVVSQALALFNQLLNIGFLLTGWQHYLPILVCWAVLSVLFSLFIRSKMSAERPTRRALRRVIRELEVLSSFANAAVIIFLSGSITNMSILLIAYVVGLSLVSEIHGQQLVQSD
jgi:hypothetical protein